MIGTDHPRALDIVRGLTADEATATEMHRRCRALVEQLLAKPSVWRDHRSAGDCARTCAPQLTLRNDYCRR